MKTIKEQIQEIYNRIENCHPSRADEVKTRKAIELLADAIDDLKQDVIHKV